MKIFYVLFIIVGVFMGNIVLYYVSEGYRGLLQNIKRTEKTPIVMNDKYKVDTQRSVQGGQESIGESGGEAGDEIQVLTNNEEGEIISEGEGNNLVIVEVDNIREDGNVLLSEDALKIVKLFPRFGLEKLEKQGTLLDITDEYPDRYIEYYSSDMTIAFFPTKNYSEVRDIFELESDTLFSINELDNFGDESFYINLLERYKDKYVRFVMLHNGNVFGIKVSENKYEQVKKILNQL